MIHHHHSSPREGVIAGLLGAGAVALLFFVRDAIQGVPFLTPSVLGQVIMFGVSTPVTDRALFAAVLSYTGLHLVVFIVFGLLLAGFVRVATTQPAFRFALVVLFIFFEFFFVMLAYMLHESTRALFPLGLVLVANLVAAVVMATYLWRHHPALRRAVRRDPLGTGSGSGHH
jgi:hypothetical protein